MGFLRPRNRRAGDLPHHEALLASSHRIPGEFAVTVRIAGIEFDNNYYDREPDVLYLHVGDPASAVGFDATPEGHHTRYGKDGSLVGLTIVSARRLLERGGEVVITLPEQKVCASDLAAVLAAA
jgi:uncharacterized protein YuzE